MSIAVLWIRIGRIRFFGASWIRIRIRRYFRGTDPDPSINQKNNNKIP
jgi:hypothetical protein